MREFPERRKTLNVFREAARMWGSYDDFPVAPAGIDPSPHLSRNQVAQPDGELVQVRLKGNPPYTEAAAWYCDNCDTFMHRVEFTGDVPQRGYASAVAEYNADARHRTCPACGQVHDRVDLADIAWDAVAEVLEGTRSR